MLTQNQQKQRNVILAKIDIDTVKYFTTKEINIPPIRSPSVDKDILSASVAVCMFSGTYFARIDRDDTRNVVEHIP